MSISLDLFPAGGGSGGLFLWNSVLLILDVVSYHFPSYFNRKNQSLFVNKSLLPTGDQGSLRGDRFFSFYMQLKTTHCRLIARAGPHTHTPNPELNTNKFSAEQWSVLPYLSLFPKIDVHISCILTRRSVS